MIMMTDGVKVINRYFNVFFTLFVRIVIKVIDC